MGQPHHHTIQGSCFSCLTGLTAHSQSCKAWVLPSALQVGRKRNGKHKMTSSWGILTFTWEENAPKRTVSYNLSAKIMSCGHTLLPGCWGVQWHVFLALPWRKAGGWWLGMVVGWIDLCCCFSIAQSCSTLCNPRDCSLPGSPVLHCLLEFVQVHVH